jgi:hypothetical protein
VGAISGPRQKLTISGETVSRPEQTETETKPSLSWACDKRAREPEVGKRRDSQIRIV